MSALNFSNESHQSDLFKLEVKYGTSNTRITMEVLSPFLYTNQIPETIKKLKRNLPSILSSKCFNPKKLPFHMEVENTEVAHLFEHILLEFLAKEKLNATGQKQIYEGWTSWNWVKGKRGIFYIDIKAGSKEKLLFLRALARAIKLTSLIMKPAPNE